PPTVPPFPYTTLFRSNVGEQADREQDRGSQHGLLSQWIEVLLLHRVTVTAAPCPSRTWSCRRRPRRTCVRKSACRRRRCGRPTEDRKSTRLNSSHVSI